MFKISKDDSYYWPVTVEIPVDGGRYEKAQFEVRFRRVPQTRFEEMMDGAREGKISDKEICREVVVGWKSIGDKNGEALDFSETNKELLLEDVLAVRAIALSYIESLSRVRRKN